MPKCGYCRQTGHNVKKCPHLDQTIENLLAKNPADSTAAYYIKRYRKEASPRKCSYCSGVGHDRRKCEEIDLDFLRIARKYREINSQAQELIEYISENKIFGQGDMISVKGLKWNYAISDYMEHSGHCVISGLKINTANMEPSRVPFYVKLTTIYPILNEMFELEVPYETAHKCFVADQEIVIFGKHMKFKAQKCADMTGNLLSYEDVISGKTDEEIYKNSGFYRLDKNNKVMRYLPDMNSVFYETSKFDVVQRAKNLATSGVYFV